MSVDLARVAGDARGAKVDVVNPSFESVPRETEPVRLEGVGLDDVGAGGDVVLVGAAHEFRLAQHQLLETGVAGDAATV